MHLKREFSCQIRVAKALAWRISKFFLLWHPGRLSLQDPKGAEVVECRVQQPDASEVNAAPPHPLHHDLQFCSLPDAKLFLLFLLHSCILISQVAFLIQGSRSRTYQSCLWIQSNPVQPGTSQPSLPKYSYAHLWLSKSGVQNLLASGLKKYVYFFLRSFVAKPIVHKQKGTVPMLTLRYWDSWGIKLFLIF